MMDIEEIKLKFDSKGLIPAIIQDIHTKQVLMMAYMNEESLEKTLKTKKTWFFSRSRQKLWNKGETSGNFQRVKNISYDCDGDSLLIQVEPAGEACHTGEKSCFFNSIYNEDANFDHRANILQNLYSLITHRANNPVEGSYTNYLLEKGIDKILKKVGEEASEVIIAAKNTSKSEMIYEIADLTYHVLVLMANKNILIENIEEELAKRYKK